MTARRHLRLVPAAPPAHLEEEIDAASERADDLAAMDRELHFETDPAGRLVVELRRLDGSTIRRVSGREALDIMAGVADAL